MTSRMMADDIIFDILLGKSLFTGGHKRSEVRLPAVLSTFSIYLNYLDNHHHNAAGPAHPGPAIDLA